MIYLRECIAGLVSPFVVGSPTRFARQLRKFAHTELYTFYDIATVAARQQGEVRAEMERHAKDEFRHYHAFRDWAVHVSPQVGANYGDPEGTRGLDEASVAASVRLPAAPNLRLASFGEYMMYIFLSESRAVLQFQITRLLNPWNERVQKQIPVLLKDEKRHVSYSLRHSLAEFRRRPWASCKALARVLVYILRQDLVDLAKLVQTVGSAVACFVLYYGIVTPYALVLRVLGLVRRDRIRSWRAQGPARLDAGFWRESS